MWFLEHYCRSMGALSGENTRKILTLIVCVQLTLENFAIFRGPQFIKYGAFEKVIRGNVVEEQKIFLTNPSITSPDFFHELRCNKF